MDAATLDLAIAAGVTAVGTPDEVAKAVENFAATGADQLAFGMLSTSMPIEACEESVETFGKHVLKDFDKDPEHLTTKQRLAGGRTSGSAGYRRKSPACSRRWISSATSAGARALGVDPVALRNAVALELGPQVVDHGRVRQRPGVRRLERAIVHPLLHDADGSPEHRVVDVDAVRLACRHEEVEHEEVEDALADGEVAALGVGRHRLGRGEQHDPVLRVRLLPPRLDGAPAQLGEEPVQVEAGRGVVEVRHQRRHGRLAAAGRPGQKEERALRHPGIIACPGSAWVVRRDWPGR